MKQVSHAAAKRSKLLPLLKFHTHTTRRLSCAVPCPPPPSTSVPEWSTTTTTTEATGSTTKPNKGDDEHTVVTQIVHLLRTTHKHDWSSDADIRRLLFSVDDPPSPRRFFLVTRRLASSSDALHFLDSLIRAHELDHPSLSSAFQAIFELASCEPTPEKSLSQLLSASTERGVPLGINSAALLIRCFGRAGMIDEALSAFAELDPSFRNTHIRNVLVDVLFRAGRFESALQVLDIMFEPDSEFSPNDMTGDIVFGALLRLDRHGRGFDVLKFAHLVSKLGENGVFPSSALLTQVINKLCRIEKAGLAWDVLGTVITLGGPVEAPACNALLIGLRKDSDYQRMNALMAMMKENNIHPSVCTFGILIDHLCKHWRVDEALELFEKMSDKNSDISIDPDVITYNTIIHGLCKVGRQEEGLALMQKMRPPCSPNTVTYNSLINGFCKSGEMDRARDLFEKMSHTGVSPNVVTVNTLVNGLCLHGRLNSAVEFFKEMEGKGLKGNASTYTPLIRAFCNANNVRKAKELFDEMLKGGHTPDAIVYYAMISGLTQAGELDDAVLVMSELKRAGFSMDVVCYNVLIGGFCKRNKVDKAYEMLEEMELSGVKPDSVTYNTMISYFSKIGDLQIAHQIMTRMKDNDLPLTVVTYGALINAYCSAGNLELAMKLFREMGSSHRNVPNTVIYNNLINWLCKEGDVETALSLLDDMKQKSVRPNTTTYNAVFKGLRRNKWLEKAWELMDRMNEDACKPDYVTMEILTEWLPAVGQMVRLKKFVEGYEVTTSRETGKPASTLYSM